LVVGIVPFHLVGGSSHTPPEVLWKGQIIGVDLVPVPPGLGPGKLEKHACQDPETDERGKNYDEGAEFAVHLVYG